MKNIYLTGKRIIFLALFLISTASGISQSFMLYESHNNGKVFITGTSTLHNWDMTVDSFKCTTMLQKPDENLIVLKDIQFKVDVKSLQSHETDGSLMNKKACTAMKADKYPYITFTSDSGDSIPLASNTFTTHIKGNLTIAGVTKEATIKVMGNYKEGKLTVNGIYPITTTDFNVPTISVFLGALKTGSIINLHFNLLLQNIQNQ